MTLPCQVEAWLRDIIVENIDTSDIDFNEALSIDYDMLGEHIDKSEIADCLDVTEQVEDNLADAVESAIQPLMYEYHAKVVAGVIAELAADKRKRRRRHLAILSAPIRLPFIAVKRWVSKRK